MQTDKKGKGAERTENRPRVSVVMATYNGERYLREQMDSILAQDYPLFEIIVQDDCSTDSTWDILKDYERQHPTLFKLFRNKQNLGFNENFRTAFLRAEGDFIAISDQDDIWLPTKIGKQVRAIGERDLCLTDLYGVQDDDINELHPTDYPTGFAYNVIFWGGCGHTMLCRRDFLRNIKDWRKCPFYDWWMTLQAQIGKGLIKLSEPLNYHRHHSQSVTTHVPQKGRWAAVEHPTWQPYIHGFFFLRHWQKQENFRQLYTYLAEQIDASRFPVEKKIAQLLLRRNLFATLRLCLICLKHYKEVYPNHPHGLSGRIHGFFAPMIRSYCGFETWTRKTHKD